MAAMLCVRFFDTDLPNGPVVTTRSAHQTLPSADAPAPNADDALVPPRQALTHIPRPQSGETPPLKRVVVHRPPLSLLTP
jgi:hypothetical protein